MRACVIIPGVFGGHKLPARLLSSRFGDSIDVHSVTGRRLRLGIPLRVVVAAGKARQAAREAMESEGKNEREKNMGREPSRNDQQ